MNFRRFVLENIQDVIQCLNIVHIKIMITADSYYYVRMPSFSVIRTYKAY
jgi:hypothetical protein